MSGFTVYLITRLDALKVCLALLGIVSFLMMLAGLFSTGQDDIPRKPGCLFSVGCGLLTMLILVVYPFIPSREDMLYILGIPAALNSRVVQQDIPVVYEKLLNRLLDELEPKKKEEKKDE